MSFFLNFKLHHFGPLSRLAFGKGKKHWVFPVEDNGIPGSLNFENSRGLEKTRKNSRGGKNFDEISGGTVSENGYSQQGVRDIS